MGYSPWDNVPAGTPSCVLSFGEPCCGCRDCDEKRREPSVISEQTHKAQYEYYCNAGCDEKINKGQVYMCQRIGYGLGVETLRFHEDCWNNLDAIVEANHGVLFVGGEK